MDDQQQQDQVVTMTPEESTALQDALQAASKAREELLAAIGSQGSGHVETAPTLAIIEAFHAKARELADQYPDDPLAWECVAQADAWLDEIRSKQ
jgi:hypothetical protein